MRLKSLPFISTLFGIAFLLTSCLGENPLTVPVSEETSITDFYVGLMKVRGKTGKNLEKDTIYRINMASYPFTIDQLNRQIYNKDSLPVGTMLDKVVVHITADTENIFYTKKSSLTDTGTDTTWVETDSIDFSIDPNGVLFKVSSNSNVMGRSYNVKINVHNQEPDSLIWSQPYALSFPDNASLSRQKALFTDGKLYVFGNDNGTVKAQYTTIDYTYSSDNVANNAAPDTWNAITLPSGTDSYSPIVWDGLIYFLAGNRLYTLDPATNLYEESEETTQLSALIAGTDGTEKRLYAIDMNGNCITKENDMPFGEPEETDENFPKDVRLCAANIPMTYNENLTRTVVLGYNKAGTEQDTTNIVCNRITNESTWTIYQQSNAEFTCPRLENPTLIYYDKKLYTFGGKSKNWEPFEQFFCSEDYGLTWKPTTKSMVFPEDFRTFYNESAEENSYSCAIDDQNYIWIVWHDGKISRGRVNHFGFAPKW